MGSMPVNMGSRINNDADNQEIHSYLGIGDLGFSIAFKKIRSFVQIMSAAGIFLL